MSGISEEQLQELANAIADQCDDMELEPEQVLDGIARSLIAAATTFGAKNFRVNVENHGTCVVTTVPEM
ncbi:hypothetical protein A9Q99_17270 [Gammaproteobacteria bacterium 45_16_T64]|nr:hypothetical protein A9Q99_17270 [Gammaproteobacteria bacterium 45_16_T64]